MNLDNFKLEAYNEKNIEHKTVIIEIMNDAYGSKYLGNIEFLFEMIRKRKEEDYRNEAYIAYYNDYPVGFITLTCKEETYEISSGIRPKYRGVHFGPLLLQEFSEAIFERYQNIPELTLIINDLNTGSQKAATLAGYTQVTKNKFIQKR